MKKILLGLLLATLASTGWGQAKFSYFGPVNGILKGSTTTWVTTNAANTDVVGLWTGTCSNTTYLRGDGTCATPPGTGGGTVNSVSQTVPAGFSVSGSPVTSTGTLAISYATGQTANNFLATPNGIAGALALRTIVAADLPLISLSTGVTSLLPVPNGGIGVGTLTGLVKGNGTSAFSAAASADVYGLWSGTCSSTTFLRGDGACATPTAGGTVTSVAMTVPSGFTITGSPVTTSGTLAIGGTLNVSAGGSGAATLSGVLKGNGTAAIGAAAAADVYGLWSGTCSSATFLRGDGACAAPSGTSFANPSGLIGMTATNGVATTAERSDATHAIDPAIVPTWTGVHTFTASGTAVKVTGTTGATAYQEFAGNANVIGTSSLIVGQDSGGTGILFQRSALPLNFYTNATLRIGIGAAGNVTIAAPTSGTTLTSTAVAGGIAGQFIGSGNGDEFVRFNNTVGDTRVAWSSAGIKYGVIQAFTNVFNFSTNGASTVLDLSVNNGVAVQIQPAGNVTINAPSSGAALSLPVVTGASVNNPGLQVANNSIITFLDSTAGTTNAGFIWYDNTNKLIFGTGNSTRVSISATGNVAINAPASVVSALSLTGASNAYAEAITAGSTTSQAFGLLINAGTNSSDEALLIRSQSTSTNYFQVFGDGGTTVGTPTGGDKGVGTINMTGCYVNNQPCLTTTSGGATKFASGVLTTAASSCTINFNGGGIASCTYNSAGNVTVNFTASYFGTGATCVPAGNNGVNLLVTGPGTPITSSANITLRTSAGTFTDGIFSLVCAGT